MKKPEKKSRQSLIVTMVLGSAAIGYLWFGFLPGQQAIAELRTDLENKRLAIAGGSVLTASIAQRQQELDKTLAYNKSQAIAANDSTTTAQLYQKIAAATQLSGVVTKQFAPEPATDFDGISKLPLKLTCVGTHKQVFELLASLEALSEPLWVESLSIEVNSKESEMLTCQLSLATFADNSSKSN